MSTLVYDVNGSPDGTGTVALDWFALNVPSATHPDVVGFIIQTS